MNDTKSVPRIEFVHRAVRSSLDDPTERAQRWHVRYIGGNGEPLGTSEQLTSRQACETNALAMASLFTGGVAAVESAFIGDLYAISAASGHRVPVLVVEAGDES